MRQALRRINVLSTAAAGAGRGAGGVSTFVFMSSIKAVADHSERRAADRSKPVPPGGLLRRCQAGRRAAPRAARDGSAPAMRMLILRPPLVYGPGVGANFAALVRLVGRGLPLPLGAIRNRRSLVYVGNLAAAVVRCLERPDVPSGTFHLSDGDAVSTPGLVRAIARAQGRPARLLPVPPCAGSRWPPAPPASARSSRRLAGSLEVSNRRFCEAFDWEPPFTHASRACRRRCGQRLKRSTRTRPRAQASRSTVASRSSQAGIRNPQTVSMRPGPGRNSPGAGRASDRTTRESARASASAAPASRRAASAAPEPGLRRRQRGAMQDRQPEAGVVEPAGPAGGHQVEDARPVLKRRIRLPPADQLRRGVGDERGRRRHAVLVGDDAQVVARWPRGAPSCAGNCRPAGNRPSWCAGSGARSRSPGSPARPPAWSGHRRWPARSASSSR